MAPNYQNGKVYCVRCDTENDDVVYVGSTVRPLSERMAEHRKSIKQRPHYKLYQLFARVGVEHFYIELLNNFPCENVEQLHAEEGRLIRLHNTMENGANGNVAGRTSKVYFEEHKDHLLECAKQYRETHKEAISNGKKEWYALNGEAVSERSKAYRDQHKEEVSNEKKDWYARNAEATKAHVRQYADANKEKIAAQKKTYYEANREIKMAKMKEYYHRQKAAKALAASATSTNA